MTYGEEAIFRQLNCVSGSFLLANNCFYLLKVLLLLLWVCVIKSHDELPFKGELVVLVEQSSLGMANMEVSENRKKMWFIIITNNLDALFFFFQDQSELCLFQTTLL